MKAMVCTGYGDPEMLKLMEVDKPVPGENEVLVKVIASAVTSGDARVRGLNVPAGFGLPMRLALGWNKPRKAVMGMSFSGVVDAVGKQVSRFKAGDEVFGSAGSGAYAEYLTIAENNAISQKPGNLSFEEAAALPFGAITSLVYLKELGELKKGQSLLINGASGSLGHFAVQLGAAYGAKVTGVCSTPNIHWVKDLGADRVIDYTIKDFTSEEVRYDLIFDTVGKVSFSQCKASLNEKGKFLMAVAGLPQWLMVLGNFLRPGKKALAAVVLFTAEHMKSVKDLAEAGTIKPVIDKIYPLEELAEAHRYVDTGHKKGSVVVRIRN